MNHTTPEEKDAAEFAEYEANRLFRPCVYCQTDTRYYCEACKRAMCGDCMPGLTCDECWEGYQRTREEECDHDTAELTAASEYEKHQAVCTSTHRPRGYRCMVPYPAGWSPRLAARAAAVVTQAKRGTIALAVVGFIGSSLILGGSDCRVTDAWEDGGALASCANGTQWSFDPDGSPTQAPQTWARG